MIDADQNDYVDLNEFQKVLYNVYMHLRTCACIVYSDKHCHCIYILDECL